MNALSLLSLALVSGAVFGSSSCRKAARKPINGDTVSSTDAAAKPESRAADIVGTITTMDSSSDQPFVWIESDPTDPTVNGRGSPKAEIRNFFQLNGRDKLRPGCVVRVWYDESMPVVDMYPEIVVAKSLALVRCK